MTTAAFTDPVSGEDVVIEFRFKRHEDDEIIRFTHYTETGPVIVDPDDAPVAWLATARDLIAQERWEAEQEGWL